MQPFCHHQDILVFFWIFLYILGFLDECTYSLFYGLWIEDSVATVLAISGWYLIELSGQTPATTLQFYIKIIFFWKSCFLLFVSCSIQSKKNYKQNTKIEHVCTSISIAPMKRCTVRCCTVLYCSVYYRPVLCINVLSVQHQVHIYNLPTNLFRELMKTRVLLLLSHVSWLANFCPYIKLFLANLGCMAKAIAFCKF